jgi:hypothetical protein
VVLCFYSYNNIEPGCGADFEWKDGSSASFAYGTAYSLPAETAAMMAALASEFSAVAAPTNYSHFDPKSVRKVDSQVPPVKPPPPRAPEQPARPPPMPAMTATPPQSRRRSQSPR